MFVFTFCLLCASLNSVKAQGNYVFSGAEAANHGSIALTTGGAVWSTQRAATPGYFSLVGTATFTGATTGSTALIDGYVKHYATAANQGATFPVGAGTTLRTVTTSGSIPSGMQVATAWIPGDPSGNLDPTSTGAAGGAHSVTSLGSGLTQVSTVGQWDWQDLSSSAAGITITVSIPDMTAFGVASSLRLVGWNGTQWINLSGSTGASGITEGSTLSGTIQSGISALGIGRSSIVVNVKVFLQGAYNTTTGLMSTTLNSLNLIPLTQPYSGAPWNYAGTESVASIPANVTDWILVELRNSSNVLQATRAAFLKNDGTIVETDGVSPVVFSTLGAGDYHIVIRHRNHLSVRTPTIQTLDGTSAQYDFTTNQNKAYQDGAITNNPAMFQTTNATYVMWGGNANGNTTVNYGAFGSDRVSILSSANTVGSLNRGLGNIATVVLNNVYSNNDLNMNGVVNYGAFGSDRVFLLTNVLGSISSGARTQHQ